MIDRDIEIFIVKALARYREPMAGDTLRAQIATAFQHVALTAGDVAERIQACEEKNFIAGTNDELLGVVWTVTAKGKIRAQQIKG